MRILIYNWKDLRHPAAGGAEVYTWEVARRLVEAGHEVCWFASRPAGLPPQDRYHGIDVVRAGGRLGVYRQGQAFWSSEGHRFDLVIDEVNTRPFFAPKFVRSAPVVALIHQVARDVWEAETPLPLALVGRYYLEPRWLAAYQDVPAVTVSPSSARSLQAYGLRRVREVGEGMELSLSPPQVPKEMRPTVISVGRLSASKRPSHLLQAMEEVWLDLPGASLWFVGAGPMERRMCEQARTSLRQLGLSGDQVVFWGRASEELKYELMARAWVLGLSSIREGWALVVDEAAASGTRTVGYRVPGLCDSIPAAGGLLTAPNPVALGSGLRRALRAASVHAGRPVEGWRGGAVTWDEVARRFSSAVRDLTGCDLGLPDPAPADPLAAAS